MCVDLGEPVGERSRPRLQDDGRLDLVQLAVAHRGNGGPARPRRHRVRAEFLAAPGPEDDVRRAAHDFRGIRDDAVAPERHRREVREAVVAASSLDHLADPADAGDQRRVPFLEVDARPARQPRCRRADRLDAGLEPGGEPGRPRLAADHAAEHADHAQDFGDAPVIEEVHLDAGARELGRDVRLQVGEAEHEIGAERDDAIDLRAGERGYFRLLAPRPRRSHREARDADDARVLAEEVERLGRLFREADDAFGIGGGHRGTLAGTQLRAEWPCATLPR